MIDYYPVLTMNDYTIFYKDILSSDCQWPGINRWDLFLSGYTSATRVQKVFDKIDAERKYWLIFPEYDYKIDEYPTGLVYAPAIHDEADYIRQFSKVELENVFPERICIDITGFIRPHLCFLVRWLAECGVKRFDAIYSEPSHYKKREETTFSDGPLIEVRQIRGFEGIHESETMDSDSKDVLIINVGYDDRLISQVAESKESARKIQLFGFPSLRADMYQENVLRAHRAKEAIGDAENYFAPANDPFVTAQVLSNIVNDARSRNQLSNLYLCPLATKPQTLGFALYYVNECLNGPASILFPFCTAYAKETSTGISRIWKYTVELP